MKRFAGHRFALAALLLVPIGCSGGGSSGTGAGPAVTHTAPAATPPNTSACASATPAPAPSPTGGPPYTPAGLTVPSGLRISVIANVAGARELTFAPNGDLFVGTGGSAIYLIRDAEAPQAGTPHVFAALSDSPAAGVALDVGSCALYAGTQFGVWRIAYTVGDQTARAAPQKIASIRSGGGGGHVTTSVAVIGNIVYASVGSSCNACNETDPTRATIQIMGLVGENMHAKAVHIRNAIALAVNPNTKTLWAGDAGQDGLPLGHPYEFFDPVSLRSGVADYGWYECEENHVAYVAGANCAGEVVPRVEFRAYQTIIGAAFYQEQPSGQFSFPVKYAGGAFVAMHGSWHKLSDGTYYSPPRVAFVAMNADTPRTPVNWSNPQAQWTDFISGFQKADGVTRIGRPTGIAVGPQGDLFVADDQTGNIYRVRP